MAPSFFYPCERERVPRFYLVEVQEEPGASWETAEGKQTKRRTHTA